MPKIVNNFNILFWESDTMNENKMKNMVVIRNLPSNIVEEAYIVLKPNQKLKKQVESSAEEQKNVSDYVVKEAEMVLNNYISNIEETKKGKTSETRKIERKYKKLKNITLILAGITILNIITILGRM